MPDTGNYNVQTGNIRLKKNKGRREKGRKPPEPRTLNIED